MSKKTDNNSTEEIKTMDNEDKTEESQPEVTDTSEETQNEAVAESSPPDEDTPSETDETVAESSPSDEDTPSETDEAVAESSPSDNDTSSETEEETESPPTLEDELTQAKEEAAQNLDKWQRAVAELANYKRRQEEQRKLQRDRIKSEVLENVVSALDDMNLAFQNLPEELDDQIVGWVEGFRLVQRKLDKILDEQNVMPIDTTEKFDPNFHEAVSYEDSDDHEDGDIIAELRKGYQIGSRVIRPALVRVAK